MSKRLNTWLRDKIVEAALAKSGIVDEQSKWQAERRIWAERVADDSVGGPDVVAKAKQVEKKIDKLLATLPEPLRISDGILPTRGSLNLNAAGCKVHVNEFEGQRPCARNHTLPADHPLVIEFFQLEDWKKDIDARYADLSSQVRAMVNSVGTVGSLLKVWPEAAELIPQSAAPVSNLPALKAEELNKLIGLPTPEPATA
ncbi:Nmad5 family putative nucleotide modification protein [Pseudomonas aeruginosa]|uniref:Nmad5 family putative nucleotide modification protein n=1 Tax=Pseudomonas aeruginosa TaxID=287 RepID=UPI000F8725CD|nr:Nmad5 family putative nucleotide modification protein [Pseudomonas aeruginosa]NPW05831.1 hypothetical protein [Pseudomonas aeruginosa]RUC20426.1 hypothetical protein IPC1399_29605 [Pseudomonas aeruginosa]HCL4106045.1 hypothetical protein [Pseudomonas aeruginosa]